MIHFCLKAEGLMDSEANLLSRKNRDEREKGNEMEMIGFSGISMDVKRRI